jgi:hypothetical protein
LYHPRSLYFLDTSLNMQYILHHLTVSFPFRAGLITDKTSLFQSEGIILSGKNASTSSSKLFFMEEN